MLLLLLLLTSSNDFVVEIFNLLYDDIYWSIYEDRQVKKYASIKADDFVFAIERIFTDNPNADVMAILKSIKNADRF